MRSGKRAIIGLELQVGPLGEDQLGQIRQSHQIFDDHDLGFVEIEMLGDEMAQMRRASSSLHFIWMTLPRRRRLSSDLEQQHQVFGLFLDFDVAVAQDAEQAPAGDAVAGEQLVEIKRDDMLQRDEARVALVDVRQAP